MTCGNYPAVVLVINIVVGYRFQYAASWKWNHLSGTFDLLPS